MDNFAIEARHERGWAVLRVSGDVDVYNAPQLRQAIQEHVEQEPHRLIVDLESVPFIDSTGLSVMIGALRRAHEHEGSLVLVAPSKQVRHVLSFTDLDKVLPVFDSVETALRENT